MADERQTEIHAQLAYRDPRAALDWLERAFGFEAALIVTGANGLIIHARAEFADQAVLLVPEEAGMHLSPASIDGINTQSIHMRFGTDIDAHCARARAAGAKILQAPRQEFYGDLTYVCTDLEGHVWRFGQSVAEAGPPPEGWKVEFPKRTK